MKANPVSKTVVDLRNAAVHQGLETVDFGVNVRVRCNGDGTFGAEITPPHLEFAGHALCNPVEAFQETLSGLRKIVEEAHKLGFVDVNEHRAARIEAHFERESENGVWEKVDPADEVAVRVLTGKSEGGE